MNKYLDKIIGSLTKLLKVRSVLTLSTWAVFLKLELDNKIDPSILVGVINILLGFWFAEKMAKHKLKGTEEKV